MHPETYPKIKRKLSWEITRNHENTIRKQSAKTSKTMLPCRRGALLAKSASFKNIPEDIEIKHEIHTKIYPKAIQKTIKNPSQK
jgi:hypothetical protein